MSDRVAYPFTRAYQIKLLALACSDPLFLLRVGDVVRPEWFDDPIHIDLARLACEHVTRHKSGPTLDATAQALVSMLDGDKKRGENREAYARAFQELMTAQLLEREDVERRAVDFARYQALTAAVLKSLEDINGGRYEVLLERAQEALRVGSDRLDRGLFYWDDTTRFEETRHEQAFRTGFPTIDKYMRGGLLRGELGIIEAPPSQFKTGTLINFGVNALKAGVDVVHYTLEMPEAVVAKRYDRCILGINPDNTTPESVRAKLAEWKARVLRRLVVKCFRRGTCTTSALRAHIHNLLADGSLSPSRPFLLIVDYGMLMVSERHYKEKRDEHRANYEGLISLGQEFRAPVWSAMQSNRAAVGKKIITMADLAECFAVAMDADFILALCQTLDERNDERLRVFMAKTREGVSGRVVDMDVNYELMRLTELPELPGAPA